MSFKISVIGCGNHSSLVHGPSYARYVQEHPDTVLAACCDLDESKAKAYREKFGFQKHYTDMRRMLQAEQPDAVCIVVPEHAICPTSIAVMEQGFHVLLEKPPGLTPDDTKRMIRTAEKSGVINQVAFNRRYHPMLSALKTMMAQQTDMPLQTLFYDFFRFGRTEPSFYTTAIHGIDTAKYLIGSDYKEVSFAYQDLPCAGPNVMNILLSCTFENGVIANLHFCPISGAVVERIMVNARDHTFFLRMPIWNGNDMPGEIQHMEKAKLVSSLSGLDVNPCQDMYVTDGFYAENKAFFDTVRAGTKSANDIRSALQSVEIADAIRRREAVWKRENL
ncbi:MAG: Gfo/Idh/MocA family oxidoreductase [Clostridia bacterium]|nr:Gfo/Idh/MocA family oxidoreductase [Clostridia bacterium]